MPTELDLPLTYTKPDVVSAHRLRFRHSTRIRLLAVLGLAALFVALVPRLTGAERAGGWLTPMGIAAAFILAPLLVYLFVPGLDYRRNPIWRETYTLHVDQTGVRLTRPGAERGFELPWPAVGQVLEDEHVFVLLFGPQQDFMAIPRHIFENEEQLAFFRQVASQRTR